MKHVYRLTMHVAGLVLLASLSCPAASEPLNKEGQRKLAAALRRHHRPHRVDDGKLLTVDLSGVRRDDLDRWVPEISRAESVLAVDLADSEATDADVAVLASLPKLSILRLSRTKVTDLSARSLADSPAISHLDLCGTKLTAEGLSALTRLKTLESLAVSNTSIEDQSISGTENWTKLVALDLGNTKVGSKALGSLAKATSIQQLNLGGTGVTNAGLRDVSKLKDLTALNLDRTKVRGVGIEHLRDLDRLKSVSAHGTPVGKSLLYLNVLKNGWNARWAYPTFPDIPQPDSAVHFTYGHIERDGNRETMMFPGTHKLAQVGPRVTLKQQEDTWLVVNTELFCVLFEGSPDLANGINQQVPVDGWENVWELWLRSPPPDFFRQNTFFDPMPHLRMQHMKERVDFVFPWPEAMKAYNGPQHHFTVLRDGSKVIIDKNEIDLRNGKRYIVIDRRGKFRDVSIP
jgi:hypothetical protein